MDALSRHNVTVHGQPDGPPIVFAHGFGCDQNMWRFVWPAFADEYRVILFDHVGHGHSDHTAFDPDRYRSLDGYAEDVLAILRALDVHGAVFVGHSVSAMIGALAAVAEPERFSRLVMVGPSPRYIDDDGLQGRLLARGHRRAAGVAGQQLPRLVGRDGAGDHGQRGPARARRRADRRLLRDRPRDRGALRARHVPVRQPRRPRARAGSDAGPAVLGRRDRAGRRRRLRRRARCPTARSSQLEATGHCPNLSAPEETTAAIQDFLAEP